MKIRNGFVSNSSSSSFCIYGVWVDADTEVAKKIQKLLQERGCDLDTVDDLLADPYEVAKTLIPKNSKLRIFSTSGCYDDAGFYIGRSWNTIGDDETGREFKESIVKEVSDIVGVLVKGTSAEEVWYNG